MLEEIHASTGLTLFVPTSDWTHPGKPEILAKCEQYTDLINDCIYDVKNNFINLGKFLTIILDGRLYGSAHNKLNEHVPHPYCSIYEFAQGEFGFSETTVKNLMSVYQNFGSQIEDYKNYNLSQLVEMTSIPSDERKLIPPDKTILEIREFKKIAKKYPEAAMLQKSFDGVLNLKNGDQVTVSEVIPAASEPEPEAAEPEPEENPTSDSLVSVPEQTAEEILKLVGVIQRKFSKLTEYFNGYESNKIKHNDFRADSFKKIREIQEILDELLGVHNEI